LSETKRIHLIGICGTAMATLAALLRQRGHHVQGSDQNVYAPMSDFLAAERINTFSGYSADHITPDLDLVVIGNAISRGNPELEEVLERKIRYCSLPEIIREQFLWGARSIVVAGTHGKTTTTALTGWLLTHGGLDPTVLVGEDRGNVRFLRRLEDVPDRRAQRARGERAELPVDGHDPPGVDRRVLVRVHALEVRVLEDEIAPGPSIERRPAEHHDAGIGGEDALEVGLVVPDRPDVPGRVGEHGVEDREPPAAGPDQARGHHAQVERRLGAPGNERRDGRERAPILPPERHDASFGYFQAAGMVCPAVGVGAGRGAGSLSAGIAGGYR